MRLLKKAITPPMIRLMADIRRITWVRGRSPLASAITWVFAMIHRPTELSISADKMIPNTNRESTMVSEKREVFSVIFLMLLNAFVFFIAS